MGAMEVGGAAPRAGEACGTREEDGAFMRHALRLAVTAAGRTNPNPLVGAVVVRDGRILGEGCHERYGDLHAERNALADCARRGEDPRGATVYVTLEPCSHQGHQPPCADALVAAGVARVVVGSRDPNPLVAGRGVARLRAAGIEVAQDVLRAECDAVNQVFFHYITTKTPYVVAKWAMTADGRVACAGTGDARWVSGEGARADCHALRNRLAAIMVGIGTVLADDPLLTCRLPGGRDPLRVVCDTRLALPEDCALVRTAGEAPLLVACGAEALDAAGTRDKAARLRDRGVEVLPVSADAAGHADLRALMAELGAREVDSVLLEGGARLMASAFAAGVVNEAVAYVAPKVVGGSAAPGPVAGPGARLMADALPLGAPHVTLFGDDVRVCWRAGTTPAERALPCVACGPLYPAACGKAGA